MGARNTLRVRMNRNILVRDCVSFLSRSPPYMIICLCNNLKEKDMASAIAQGAQCVSDVYKHHGCKPQCGKCVPYVREEMMLSSGAMLSASAQ